MSGAAPFVSDGLREGEAVMVATTPSNLAGLGSALGGHADAVRLVDITEAGLNPGRMLSMLRQFVDSECADASRPARAIGEPVWVGRSRAELDECARHEALINDALDPDVAMWLVCPYDASALGPAALAPVASSHPMIHGRLGMEHSGGFDAGLGSRALEGDLPAPPPDANVIEIDGLGFGPIRDHVAAVAAQAGLSARRIQDLRLVATELATNVRRHGAGTGTVRAWAEGDSLVCQADDAGSLLDPLVGRRRPGPLQPDGYGLWIVHQLCDLVQVRSSARGTVVRATMRLA